VQERFATASTIMRLTESAFGQLKVWHRLHKLLERADLPLRTVELVYMSLGVGALGGIVSLLFGGGFFALLLAFAGSFMLPILFVAYKARKRLTLLEDQLPDLLITLAASLKAGHSFRQGIQAVVDEGQPPASTEFKRVLTETRLGRPMDAALQDMGDRVGSKNLSFVITAVTIQRQVGGSLAGIFDMVAEAVRQRQQFARKIRSLTAMGRASAYVLCGIPFFMLGVLTLMNREYMEPLYNTSTGHKLMIFGVVMMVIGSLMLRKIVSFRG
jgi:tight adherence protein B